MGCEMLQPGLLDRRFGLVARLLQGVLQLGGGRQWLETFDRPDLAGHLLLLGGGDNQCGHDAEDEPAKVGGVRDVPPVVDEVHEELEGEEGYPCYPGLDVGYEYRADEEGDA